MKRNNFADFMQKRKFAKCNNVIRFTEFCCSLLGTFILVSGKPAAGDVSFTDDCGQIDKDAGVWPWMAALGSRDMGPEPEFFCGGTLITSRHVLTAAHCIPLGPTFVRLGAHDLKLEKDYTDVEIKTSLQTPHHNPWNRVNDIALLFLKDDVRFTNKIKPACLPPFNMKGIEEGSALTTGWGLRVPGTAGGRVVSTVQPMDINVLNDNTCQLYYPSFQNYTQMCGMPKVAGDCHVDTGGPLLHKNSMNKYTLIGIASGGLGCVPGYAVYFTRVSSYVNWIKEEMTWIKP